MERRFSAKCGEAGRVAFLIYGDCSSTLSADGAAEVAKRSILPDVR
jgi:hypothetical protein